ncbi:MAG: GGDEF domain-containing protein [Clostridia bacterium]
MDARKYLIKIPGLSHDEQTKFIYANLELNLERLKIAGLVFVVAELVMLIVALLPGILNISGAQRENYIILYLIIIPFMLLFTTALHYMKKKLKYKYILFFRLIISTGLMLILIWGVCVILFGYDEGFLPNIYIFIMLSVAVVPFLSFWEIISIMAPSQTLLTLFILAMNPFGETIAVPLLMDAWGFFIISITISILFYSLRVDSYSKDLQLISQNNMLKQHSEIDALTDVYNRRKLDEMMETEWKRSGRSGKEFSLLLIDLDHFKTFNDTYGHIEGDLCLRKAAEIMKNTLKRSTDSIYRYGGEEFAIILPFTPIDAAGIVAEKLRRNIENACIPNINSDLGKLTISLGISSAIGNKNMEFNSMYIDADKALYAAKRSGRNRVIAFEG